MAKLMVLTSPDVIAPGGTLHQPLVDVLKKLKGSGNPVAAISNGTKPAWFDAAFAASGVQFLQQRGRQDGKIVEENANRMGLPPQNTIVLAGKNEDMQMGKNGGAVLIAANWCADKYLKSLGIDVDDAPEFEEVISLCDGWNESWWFEGSEPRYAVAALSDLSSYNKPLSQQEFSEKVTYLVKQGGPKLKSLLVTAARSLLASGFHKGQSFWAVFPSSRVSAGDSEVLSDFTHRLRTTVSTMRLAKRDEPLFIRHAPSVKRSSPGKWIDRTDPADQLRTLHLNPTYKKNLAGRHVVVVDDVTTHGLSFGVATALLRQAGVAKVTGLALGKFGNTLKYYEIDVKADVFAPLLSPNSFSVSSVRPFVGTTNVSAQNTLRSLLT